MKGGHHSGAGGEREPEEAVSDERERERRNLFESVNGIGD